MTPAGIESATFRFVAQHLNHCATAVPRNVGQLERITYFKPIEITFTLLFIWYCTYPCKRISHIADADSIFHLFPHVFHDFPGKWCDSFSDLCSSSGCLFPVMAKTDPFNLNGQELQISSSATPFPNQRRRNVPFKKWREAPNWWKVKWSQSSRGHHSVKCVTFPCTL